MNYPRDLSSRASAAQSAKASAPTSIKPLSSRFYSGLVPRPWERISIQPSRAKPASGTFLARDSIEFAADCHVCDGAREEARIERYIMRYFIMLVLLGGVYATTVGCEAKVDDDSAKV